MNASQISIILSVAIFLTVALLNLIFTRRKQEKTFTPMTILAHGFILTGILYSSNSLLGYSLMGIGVILAMVDMVRKCQAKT